MIKALAETVLPAVDPSNKATIEQAVAVKDYLNSGLMVTRVIRPPAAGRCHRTRGALRMVI